ncbi:hypothetical protein SH661x_004600 [Planctomicrobium sp. SH661]|uniref:hypothetical protein n=1 Tax=Planctomicrobium sp. SH661 TaxID=3448124 RepID=UPI003F5B52B4
MQSTFQLTRQRCSLAILFLAFGLLGCQQDDGIRQYTVEKIPAPQKKKSPAVVTGNAPAWFLKMTGPADSVLKQIVPFSQIVKSLSFDLGGNPQMELPAGWTQSDGPPPRYKTIKVPDTDPPLELTVSSLPGPQSAPIEYLLSNINRWRGQLGKPEYESDNWLEEARNNGEVVIVPLRSRAVVMVNLLGEIPDQGPSRVLGAIILSIPGASGSEQPQEQAPVSAKPPIDFTPPESWVASAGNAMRIASFEAKHESGVADVSVSRFPGGGDELSNVNRWRGQVKLDPLSEDEFKSSAKQLEIGGQAATYVELVGPEQSILAAILPDGDAKWFFKMQGPKDAVAAETAHFEEFLKSVKFEK